MNSLSAVDAGAKAGKAEAPNNGSTSAEASPRPVLPTLVEAEQLCALLTPKEREVITYVAAGLADKEIATRLHTSENTVHNHIKNILAKPHCHNRTAAAVAFALGQRECE